MTRARTHTWEFGNQPLSQLLLAAVLCALVSLVQGVAAMFGMRGRSSNGDWHTEAETSALPQTKPDIQIKDKSATASFRLAVDAQRRTQTLTHTSRPKADLLTRVVRGGGHPALRAAQAHNHGRALTRAVQTPACAGKRLLESRV